MTAILKDQFPTIRTRNIEEGMYARPPFSHSWPDTAPVSHRPCLQVSSCKDGYFWIPKPT